jgi:hypothetical protein
MTSYEGIFTMFEFWMLPLLYDVKCGHIVEYFFYTALKSRLTTVDVAVGRVLDLLISYTDHNINFIFVEVFLIQLWNCIWIF